MKKILIVILAVVLVFTFATTAFAASFDWSSGFDQNQRTSYNYYDTCAIQMSLYSLDDSTISEYLGVDGDGWADTYDGGFGYGTEDAVQEFQSDNGLTADGIVGTNTWAKLRSECYNNYWYDVDGNYAINNDDFYNYIEINGTWYYGRNHGFVKYNPDDEWEIFTSHGQWAVFES